MRLRAAGPLLLALVAPAPLCAQQKPDLYRSPAFVVTDSSVQQGQFRAVALSRRRIVTNYPRTAKQVRFKFSLNGYESEFPPGGDHGLFIRPRNGQIITRVYTFGVPDSLPPPRPEESVGGGEGVAQVTFRLDMRPVLRSFRERGYFDPNNGPRITAKGFQGVYVVGNSAPLTWDFSTLHPGSRFQLTDPDGDSIYTVTLPFQTEYPRPLDAQGRAVWEQGADLSNFPSYTSSQRLVDALYRLSLEELTQLVQQDTTFAAGARWPGVWTRDVSFATVLSLAAVAPDLVRRSLLRKVDAEGRIIQDTGTGGSWPISTDRVAWAVAAWELYGVTGDRGWLRTAYDAIRRSAEADLRTAFDPVTGLFHGETSFLDWREQTYPRWMDPKDIFEGEALGTNALHYETYRILGRMARELGEPAARWDSVAAAVREGVNEYLWQPERGWYGEYRYGRVFPALSPRAEAEGEAFSILFGVADSARSRELASRMPTVTFGVPTVWPYTPGIPPYHNDSVWPQVLGFWGWAGAEVGNTAAVEHSLGSLYRAAALFLTNKENFVASTGHFEGTAINSDRQLWSVAADLATVYRVLLGMRFGPDRLLFRPFVPAGYAGEHTLRGFHYRGAVLDVTVRGFGAAPARVLLDGKPVPRAEIPATLTGAHSLVIEMDGRLPEGAIHHVADAFAPHTPHPRLYGDHMAWVPVPDAKSYAVYRDGHEIATTAATTFSVRVGDALAEYQVLAIGADGLRSFLSEPLRVAPPSAVVTVQMPGERADSGVTGYTGAGFLRLERQRDNAVTVTVQVPAAGEYAIDLRYANGSGPINTSDKAAIRSLFVDGERAGALVMPQRGTDLWSDWGWSSALRVRLDVGSHTLTLRYTPSDENMNRLVNTALVDEVRLSRVGGGP